METLNWKIFIISYPFIRISVFQNQKPHCEKHCYVLLFWSFYHLEWGKIVKSERKEIRSKLAKKKIYLEVEKGDKTKLHVPSWEDQFWVCAHKRVDDLKIDSFKIFLLVYSVNSSCTLIYTYLIQFWRLQLFATSECILKHRSLYFYSLLIDIYINFRSIVLEQKVSKTLHLQEQSWFFLLKLFRIISGGWWIYVYRKCLRID